MSQQTIYKKSFLIYIHIPFNTLGTVENIGQFEKYFLIVYQMGRLCGGAHEISGIKAQIFLREWVRGGGSGGGVGRGGGSRVGDGGVGVVGGVIRLSF